MDRIINVKTKLIFIKTKTKKNHKYGLTFSLKRLIIFFILFICLILAYTNIFVRKKIFPENIINYNIMSCKNNNNNRNNITKGLTLETVIKRLIEDEYLRCPKYILLFDFYNSKYCEDINAYYIFEYYQNHNILNAFYIINKNSNFYYSLLAQKKTKNLIPLSESDNIWDVLYPYLLDSLIIVQSYVYHEFQIINDKVHYIKYLKINHGIRFFKAEILSNMEFIGNNKTKIHTIVSSPYEYNLTQRLYGLPDKNIHKAGLARYDRFKKIINNHKEKECILISFSYREYNYSIFESYTKKNVLSLLNDEILISSLKNNNIDLIFIQHHHDLSRGYIIDNNSFYYARYTSPKYLGHYIEKCNLLVTDYSSLSFDFMFQNKPTLFYLLDYSEDISFREKDKIMKNFPIVDFTKNNTFFEKKTLINKIQYYINRKFNIENELKNFYENIFFLKQI